MVFLNVKRYDQVQFLIEAPAGESVASVTASASRLHNLCRKITRVCDMGNMLLECIDTTDDAAHQSASQSISSTASPPQEDSTNTGSAAQQMAQLAVCSAEHHSDSTEHTADGDANGTADDASQADSDDEGVEAVADSADSSVQGARELHELPVEGGAQPSKRPCVGAAAAAALNSALEAATCLIDKERVAEKQVLTCDKAAAALETIESATNAAFPGGWPHHLTPLGKEYADDFQAPCEGPLGDLRPEATDMWFAGRLLAPGQALAQCIGRHKKTRAVVWLQRKGEGAPVREKGITEAEYNEMLAYYYKKTEEHKKLEEDMDMSYLNSDWADPGALKRHFHGVGSITLPGR